MDKVFWGISLKFSKASQRKAARRRQIELNHFASGRVPDAKYLTGCKSSAAALCRAQPPKAALSAELCELAAYGGQLAQQTAIPLFQKAVGLLKQTKKGVTRRSRLFKFIV